MDDDEDLVCDDCGVVLVLGDDRIYYLEHEEIYLCWDCAEFDLDDVKPVRVGW